MASFLFLDHLVGAEDYRGKCRECVDWAVAQHAQRAIQACLEVCERPPPGSEVVMEYGRVLFEALADGAFQYFAPRPTLCEWLVRRLQEHRQALSPELPAWETGLSELGRAVAKLRRGFGRVQAGQPSLDEGEVAHLGSDEYVRVVVITGLPSEFASERLVRGELSRFGVVEWVKVGSLHEEGAPVAGTGHAGATQNYCAIALMKQSQDANLASASLDGAVLCAHVTTRAAVDVDGAFCRRVRPIAMAMPLPLGALAARVAAYWQGDADGTELGQGRGRRAMGRKEWHIRVASSAPEIAPPPPTRPAAQLCPGQAHQSLEMRQN